MKHSFTSQHILLSHCCRFEMIDSMCAEEYHKVLVNIRKAEARNKRLRTMKRNASELESEDETPKPGRGR